MGIVGFFEILGPKLFLETLTFEGLIGLRVIKEGYERCLLLTSSILNRPGG